MATECRLHGGGHELSAFLSCSLCRRSHSMTALDPNAMDTLQRHWTKPGRDPRPCHQERHRNEHHLPYLLPGLLAHNSSLFGNWQLKFRTQHLSPTCHVWPPARAASPETCSGAWQGFNPGQHRNRGRSLRGHCLCPACEKALVWLSCFRHQEGTRVSTSQASRAGIWAQGTLGSNPSST